MAVPALPFWMSQANQEFLGTTTGWAGILAARNGQSFKVKLTAVPRV